MKKKFIAWMGGIFLFYFFTSCVAKPEPAVLANADYGNPPSQYEETIQDYKYKNRSYLKLAYSNYSQSMGRNYIENTISKENIEFGGYSKPKKYWARQKTSASGFVFGWKICVNIKETHYYRLKVNFKDSEWQTQKICYLLKDDKVVAYVSKKVIKSSLPADYLYQPNNR